MTARSKDVVARDAYLALSRAHDALASQAADFFKGHGLTQTQYNALRILRGAGPEGLPCQEVGARLIHRVPDVTRLLDRMEKSGLVRRERSVEDRRVVLAHLEPKGKSLLDALDEPVLALHRGQFKDVSRAELLKLEVALNHLAARLPRPGSDGPGQA